MKKHINLMIGTNYHGQGGIATVVQVLRSMKLWDEWNVRYINTHSSSNKTKLSSIILYLTSLFKIFLAHLFNNVGVSHIHMSSRGSFIRKSLIVRLCKILGSNVIIHLHGSEFQIFYNEESGSFQQKYIRNTFNKADSVIVLSTQWASWMHTIVNDINKVSVVYNAVPSLKLDRSNVVKGQVLFLGRLGKRKGVDDLIMAFKKVVSSVSYAKLLLGGDGPIEQYKDKISELGLTDNIECIGWVAGEHKANLLNASDVYVLPSYNEGFPMGVLEAMSSGVVVVSSTAGGIPDAITNKEEGLLIEPGDIDALAEALVEMITNRVQNQELSNRAKNKFDNCFSINAIEPQLEKIYKELSMEVI
ncbi:glycosyltransferase family 4 protein [Photobacterium sp. DNB22_13_2]